MAASVLCDNHRANCTAGLTFELCIAPASVLPSQMADGRLGTSESGSRVTSDAVVPGPPQTPRLPPRLPQQGDHGAAQPHQGAALVFRVWAPLSTQLVVITAFAAAASACPRPSLSSDTDSARTQSATSKRRWEGGSRCGFHAASCSLASPL